VPNLTLLDPTRTGRQAMDLENQLHRLVVDQGPNCESLLDSRGGIVSSRPADRKVLLLGPTGSVKTRIVEATAESLLKNPRAVVKIDCAEFQHSHEIAKLIGSPHRLSYLAVKQKVHKREE
jgi:ATP-dependent Clp protease ATP-binding subunit ClpB